MKTANRFQRAFTLIELSIVLVVIGLIIGGVLVGRDLINAAAVRSQLTQMEKIQTAVNTFRGKFDGYLPGDIRPELVTRFGFTAAPTRAGIEGRGDGNGELLGFAGPTAYAWNQSGENLFFWEDLTTNTKLLEGNFNFYIDNTSSGCLSSACSVFFPDAKIGNGNMLYVYNGYAANCCPVGVGFGPNFIGITRINGVSGGSNVGNSGITPPTPSLSVAQSYNMDKKVDDALPLTGMIIAQYLGSGGTHAFAPNAPTASSSTCYDTTTNQYSITQNNGAGINCALSFQIK